MNLIERAKNILCKPKTEWVIIDSENHTHTQVLTSYLLWIALIPAAAVFISRGIIGYRFIDAGLAWGIKGVVQQYISMVAGAYLSALVFNELAPRFGAEKNFNKAFQLAAYCYTAICVGGIFYIHWSLAFLASLAAAYSLYLLYVGMQPLMNVPKDKATAYYIASLLCMIVVAVVLSVVLGIILGISNLGL